MGFLAGFWLCTVLGVLLGSQLFIPEAWFSFHSEVLSGYYWFRSGFVVVLRFSHLSLMIREHNSQFFLESLHFFSVFVYGFIMLFNGVLHLRWRWWLEIAICDIAVLGGGDRNYTWKWVESRWILTERRNYLAGDVMNCLFDFDFRIRGRFISVVAGASPSISSELW